MTLALYPLAVRGLTWPITKTHDFSTIVQTAPNEYTTRIVQSQNPIWHWNLTYNYLKDNPQDLVSSLSPYTDYRYMEGFLLSNQGQFAEFLFPDVADDAIGMNPQLTLSATYPGIFRNNQDMPLGAYILDNQSTPQLQKVTTPGRTAATGTPSFGGGTTTSGTVIFTSQGNFSGANAQAVPLVNNGSTYYSPVQRNFGGQFLEDVTDLNTTVYALKVWANGVLKTAGGDYTVSSTPGLAIPGHSYQGLYITWSGTPTGPITMAAQFYFRVRLESDSEDLDQFMQQLWTAGGAESKGSNTLKLQSSRAALV